MQSLPTTEVILNDLAKEVREQLIPAIGDPALRVNLEMMEQLLTAAAVRAGHEIAWMNGEVEAIVPFTRKVAGALNDDATQAALAEYDKRRSDSLHLEDQVNNYSLASEALGRAIEAADQDPELMAEGTALIRARRDTEREIRPGFYFPGRS